MGKTRRNRKVGKEEKRKADLDGMKCRDFRFYEDSRFGMLEEDVVNDEELTMYFKRGYEG